MKHALSEAEKDWRSRPFSHTGRFWGAATVACVVVPYYLWQAEFYRILVFVPYLLASAGVGFAVVLVRRILRPPRSVLNQTFIEVSPGGIWSSTPNSRTLILAAPQIQTVKAVRSPFKKVVRVAVDSNEADISFTGLDNMDAFLKDVVSTYPRCVLVNDEEVREHAQREP